MVTIPWTQVSSLDEALAQLVAAAERLPEDTLPFRLGGEPPAAIEKRSKALPRPIPEPICQLYGAIRASRDFPLGSRKVCFCGISRRSAGSIRPKSWRSKRDRMSSGSALTFWPLDRASLGTR